MPTVQVTPSSSESLRDVANLLAKSKKVVVVTGAGISTNSGIPVRYFEMHVVAKSALLTALQDFRSQNGLYSLIQAQFEKAEAAGSTSINGGEDGAFPDERPVKRWRASHDGPPESTTSDSRSASPAEPSSRVSTQQGSRHQAEGSMNGASAQSEVIPRRSSTSSSPWLRHSSPVLPSHLSGASKASETGSTIHSNHLGTSSSSSSSAVTPRKDFMPSMYSSSPLSSPPPVIFDPYREDLCEGSRSESPDTEDTTLTDVFSSQASQPALRNMKGRDLFDCNIWSDPLKTSVFYRFATSLRQKVKDVEPTRTHHFIATLRDGGKLARVYTQNIDEIEKKIGLSTDLKSGAGTRRRRSTKVPSGPNSEKSFEEGKEDDKPDENSIVASSQTPEDTGSAKPKVSYTTDKGVECVFLHGSLHALRCFACGQLSDWDDDERESRTMAGEQPDCPHCAGATAARLERGKRALGVGKLRPDIVLYGEEHPQSESISSIVQHDLSAGPDLLLVLGTRLRVHGLKVMVREFAKSVHNKGGKVVFVNFTKPSDSMWGDVIDYWIEWDCDAWVDDLRERKPVLWMSPEAALDYEKQQKEAKREEKREAVAEKKRESAFLKRQREAKSLSMKHDAASAKRRRTIDVVVVPEPTEPRPPPKNPICMRDDHACVGMLLSKISDAFGKMRGEPFDLFSYKPDAKPSIPPERHTISTTTVVARRSNKTRKSAPAVVGPTVLPQHRPQTYIPPPRPYGFPAEQRIPVLQSPAFRSNIGLQQISSQAVTHQAPPSAAVKKTKRPTGPIASSMPLQTIVLKESSPSIVAAVKENHRVRRPKARFDPGVSARRPRTKTAKSQAVQSCENTLPPLRIQSTQPKPPSLTAMEPDPNMNLPSPLAASSSHRPLATLSPNQRVFGMWHICRNMMTSAPLGKLPYRVEGYLHARTPSTQLREEMEARRRDLGL
jgi:NAD-dependent SIR2 family protein deacetylase